MPDAVVVVLVSGGARMRWGAQEEKHVNRFGLCQLGLRCAAFRFTFIAALVANFITFRHRLAAAILASLLFAAIFVFATYSPHGIALPTLK